MPYYRLTIETDDEAISMEYTARDDADAEEKAKERERVARQFLERNRPAHRRNLEVKLMRWLGRDNA